jgi:GNAT superfamily N-acetyltransferase
MLDMLGLVFGDGTGWFTNDLANCTPPPSLALDEEISKHYVALADGKIVGVLGAYPSTLYVSENKRGGAGFELKAFGIGQVAVEKEYRKQGIMTRLMDMAIDDNVRDGAVIGFLGGDRTRYGHFGFDFGGACASFQLRRGRLGGFVSDVPLPIRPVWRNMAHEDWILINSMYEVLPSYIKRDRREWERHFMRNPYEWIIGDNKAYICVYHDKIVEAQGEAELVIRMIYDYMVRKGMSEIRVLYPECGNTGDALYAALWRVASRYTGSSDNVGLVAIFNPDLLLDALHPALDMMYTVNRTDEQKMQLLKYLFGNPAQPVNVSGFEGLRPFVFWVPKVNEV